MFPRLRSAPASEPRRRGLVRIIRNTGTDRVVDLVRPWLQPGHSLDIRTQLTRRTIHRVLTGSLRLDDFKRNPQAFIELAAEAINRRKRLAVVDGIKYQRLGDQHYYAQELFEQEELTGYLKNMLTETKKSVYEEVIYDKATLLL